MHTGRVMLPNPGMELVVREGRSATTQAVVIKYLIAQHRRTIVQDVPGFGHYDVFYGNQPKLSVLLGLIYKRLRLG
jgi:hypothetical protein